MSKIYFVFDLHICILSDEISSRNKSTVEARRAGFVNQEGKTSEEYFSEMIDFFNESDADLIVFGADIIDFCSEANINCLKTGLNRLKKPFVYIRADHDSMPYYLDTPKEIAMKRQNSVCDNSEVMKYSLDNVNVVLLNNSTENITERGLNRFKEIYAEGKPIFLVIHVPVKSKTDNSLAEKSEEVWQGRQLLWGNDCNYKPNAQMTEFLNIVYSENSLVKEIFAGHVHFDWDGMVTDTCHEHVFGPAFCKGTESITY